MIIINLIKRKGGRVVNCTNFENWRGFAVTGGSNPSLSVFCFIIFYQLFLQIYSSIIYILFIQTKRFQLKAKYMKYIRYFIFIFKKIINQLVDCQFLKYPIRRHIFVVCVKEKSNNLSTKAQNHLCYVYFTLAGI